jgi:arylsulfatase A-like enzyme
VDWNIGRVIEELDKLGLRENTIIVVWGDHGYHLGEKGKWSKHGSLYEIGTRVPLIVIAPGAKGNGQTCPRVVQSLDIYPTLTAQSVPFLFEQLCRGNRASPETGRLSAAQKARHRRHG